MTTVTSRKPLTKPAININYTFLFDFLPVDLKKQLLYFVKELSYLMGRMMDLFSSFFNKVIKNINNSFNTAIFFFIFSTFLYSQQYNISDIVCREYTIDHFTNDIYQVEYFSGKVFKTNFSTLLTTETSFARLPVFANKSHKAAYYDYNKKGVCLFNFENNTTKFICYSNYDLDRFVFTPSDKFLVLEGDTARLYDIEKDSLFFCNNASNAFGNTEWISDSHVLSRKPHNTGFCIIEYNLFNEKTDTLLVSERPNDIVCFTYDSIRNSIFYGTGRYRSNSQLRCFNKETKTDSVIYELKDDLTTKTQASEIYNLKMSIDNNFLGIISLAYLENCSDLFVYNIDKKKIFKITLPGHEEGGKSSLNWIENNNFVYIAFTSVYAFKIPDNITDVKIYNKNKMEYSLINNYPNPFNNSTRMHFNFSTKFPSAFNIYNSLGKLVKTFKIDKDMNNNDIDWDGKDNNGNVVSSGIYYGIFNNNSGHDTQFNIVKMVFIK